MPQAIPHLSARDVAQRLSSYAGAWNGVALLQLLGNLIGLLACYAAMVSAIEHGLGALVPLLWLPAAVLLVRLFIIQHDAGHGSFFSTRRANRWAGRLISLFSVTPYAFWREAHNRHHATSGDLDNSGVGDVFTCSVAQYNAMRAEDQARYRRFRHPAFMILFGAPMLFLLRYRTPFFQRVPPAECWRSILALDLGLLLLYGAAIGRFGWLAVVVSVVPTLIITSWGGAWLFYVQHQYPAAYWRRHEEWDYFDAALWGSSFYDLPPWLHWCSGHIGLHHIHHLCPGIPNYRLQAALAADPELRAVGRVGLKESLACTRLALWDEGVERLVSFAEARERGLIGGQ